MLAAAGFLGLNGSGKSTLMRILAGEDKDFNGEMFKADGIHVAYLEQEPRLDSGATVDDNIRPAVARMQSVLDEYNKVRGGCSPSLPPCGWASFWNSRMREIVDAGCRRLANLHGSNKAA